MRRTNVAIEDLLAREIKTLCDTCAHVDDCVHHRTSAKAIIQCELFELDKEHSSNSSLKGLCASCDHAYLCKLPGRKYGVWHCNQFE